MPCGVGIGAVTAGCIALAALPGYSRDMVDLKLQTPAAEEVEVDAETLAAIDRGIKDADEGRTVSVDDARKMISKWISKFELQQPR
jgi:predicted transcriptional regulator